MTGTYHHDDHDGGFLNVDHSKTPDAAGVVLDARDCFVPLAKVPELVAAIQGKAAESASEHEVTDPQLAALDEAQRAYIFDTAELKRDNDRLRAELEQARADNRRLDRGLTDTIDDRERAQDMADRLAYAIAPIEVIGEHSSGNCPWANAYNITQERDWPGRTPACSCHAELVHQAGCAAA